jgi:PPIC-type PPIASE domain
MIRASATSTLLATALAALLSGCDGPALQAPADGGVPMFGLTAEQASRVLAKVGDKTITLGDFGRTLERMDQFDRLRYQTKERRRELLSEIIDVELLALEAKRRGLDKDPEVQDTVRQILRDALLAQTRQGLPAPADISAQQIQAYYEANVDKFTEPERRRVSAIVMSDKRAAEQILKEAQKASTATAWGELVLKHSLAAPKDKAASTPVDLAGDLGIVGPTSDARGGNPTVPEPVRATAFQIASIGGVADQAVEAGGRFYIVRLSGITAGHKRTLAEADRSIRVALLQQKQQEQEHALEEEMKKQFPIEINETALASVKLPGPLASPDGAGAPKAPPAQQSATAMPSHGGQ